MGLLSSKIEDIKIEYNSNIEVIIDNQIDNHSTIFKYRAPSYDIHDEKYATVLSEIFNNLPNFIKNDFNNITNNLMSCKKINRYCLLNAIRDFEDYNPHINNNYMWIRFNDSAFNYQPSL
jgi:hypothetical protein